MLIQENMRNTKISFSQREQKDLLKSWGVVSLVFAIAFSTINTETGFLLTLIIAGITAGLGFLLHELAHKFTANYFGCTAEYHANNTMLWMSLAIALIFKAIFIAPGAVMIRGVQSQKENGIISAAGPATNIALAVIFMAGLFMGWNPYNIFYFGIIINAWLALFNMIPIMPFDGRKVWVWNKPVYIMMTSISVLLVFGVSMNLI